MAKSVHKHINTTQIIATICVFALTLQSCIRGESKSEAVCFVPADQKGITLLKCWNIIGTFTNDEDSVNGESIIRHIDFRDGLEANMTSDSLHKTSVFTARSGNVDFREVFSIQRTDSIKFFEQRSCYVQCNLHASTDTIVYLNMESSMPHTVWLQGCKQTRKAVQGLDIYGLQLHCGDNDLVVKFELQSLDNYFEATLHDSISITRKFCDGQSSNIAYAIVNDSKDIMLTNGHQYAVEESIPVKAFDETGRIIKQFTLAKDTFVYPIHDMEWNHSYLLTMEMAGRTVRQPVLCGNDDDALQIFNKKLDNLPATHSRRLEIKELLYRLEFLLNHPSRYEGDWWWQFKIPAVTYQLEHAFANLDKTYGSDNAEPNIMFVSYRSEQDDSIQHYILARPNIVDKNKPLPVVVVVRPEIEKPYHFFSCPQLARQWAVNQMQAMAERYQCLIMMPEMRMSLSEDVTPTVEKEFMIAFKHLQKHYPVDLSKVFLHGNCTGGYRALKLAIAFPNLFSAIGLYAPLYHCHYDCEKSKASAPEHKIKSLKDVRVYVHGDPCDTHSPYSFYEDLLSDCKRNGVNVKLNMKRNSGKAYNVVLVGQEAMSFFFNQE